MGCTHLGANPLSGDSFLLFTPQGCHICIMNLESSTRNSNSKMPDVQDIKGIIWICEFFFSLDEFDYLAYICKYA